MGDAPSLRTAQDYAGVRLAGGGSARRRGGLLSGEMKKVIKWRMVCWSQHHSCWLMGETSTKMTRIIVSGKSRKNDTEDDRILRCLKHPMANPINNDRSWFESRGI